MMAASINWGDLIEEHELAYFRADVCLGSPESYSLAEKRRICEGMETSAAEIDAAMRADFETMPREMQRRMLDMLGARGTAERSWWEGILLLFDAPPATA